MYKNKLDQKRSTAKWYANHKDITILRAKRFTALARKRNQNFVNSIKKASGCIDCGLTDIRCLDFDHLPEFKKAGNLAAFVNGGWSIERLQTEIDKCVVRCANCHRIKTAERRQELLAPK